MEFKFDDVTVKILNPEALPNAKKNLANLIMEMARKELNERRQRK